MSGQELLAFAMCMVMSYVGYIVNTHSTAVPIRLLSLTILLLFIGLGGIIALNVVLRVVL